MDQFVNVFRGINLIIYLLIFTIVFPKICEQNIFEKFLLI